MSFIRKERRRLSHGLRQMWLELALPDGTFFPADCIIRKLIQVNSVKVADRDSKVLRT